MKKILVILVLITGLTACENQKISFPDYKYSSGFFPYQYPVRTLVLGDYIYDNTNDNNHKFLISAALGGVRTNNLDRQFNIALDPTLCNRVLFTSSLDTIRLMPANYYSLSSSDKIIIPKGQWNGDIEVQLTDAFFNDPLAIKNTYVIPMRLNTSLDVDTILQGKPMAAGADPRVVGQWVIVPKDFTMFAVKFINPYHGKYLHKGRSVVKDASSTVLETTVYRKAFIEQNEIWSLVTTGKSQVSVQGALRSALITGTLKMLLTFADNGDCMIAQNVGSTYTITGTGKFMTNADQWGDKPRDAIYLNYQVTSGANTYYATDTLVVRDRAIVLETFVPKIF